MERMIIAGKILIAPKSHVIDRALQEYHENFMYFYDDVDHALELIDKVQRNYEYFSTVAALSGKALRHVTEKYGTDGICEALLDYLWDAYHDSRHVRARFWCKQTVSQAPKSTLVPSKVCR